MTKRHKGVSKPKLHLPYSPTLGVHHMLYENRHCTKGYEKTLRNFGAFVLDTMIAKPPQHTLLHRTLLEPPRPNRIESYDMLEIAKEAGLIGIMRQVDNPTTAHFDLQLSILAIPTPEAVERLTRKQYPNVLELRRIAWN